MAKFLPTMKFINPYDPYKDDIEVFMIICPSHQVHYEEIAIVLFTLFSSDNN